MALHLKSTGIDFTDFGDATESSELFDDYEEGTWTGVNNLYAGQSTVTDEIYCKVGRLVHASAESHFSGGGNNFNGCGVSGLPFTSVSGQQTNYEGVCHPETAISVHPSWQIGTNSTSGAFNNAGAGAQRYNMTLRDLGDNGVYFSIWYPT